MQFKWLVPGFFVWLTMSFSYAASHHPQEILHAMKGTKNEGEQVVQHFCANCHAVKPLISLGAPKIQQKNDWEPRLKKGFMQLLQHTTEGFNAMPTRGGCFECTDEQLLLAILAMLPADARQNYVKKDK